MAQRQSAQFDRRLRKALRACREFDRMTMAFLTHITNARFSSDTLIKKWKGWQHEAAALREDVRLLSLQTYFDGFDAYDPIRLQVIGAKQSVAALSKAVRAASRSSGRSPIQEGHGHRALAQLIG